MPNSQRTTRTDDCWDLSDEELAAFGPAPVDDPNADLGYDPDDDLDDIPDEVVAKIGANQTDDKRIQAQEETKRKVRAHIRKNSLIDLRVGDSEVEKEARERVIDDILASAGIWNAEDKTKGITAPDMSDMTHVCDFGGVNGYILESEIRARCMYIVLKCYVECGAVKTAVEAIAEFERLLALSMNYASGDRKSVGRPRQYKAESLDVARMIAYCFPIISVDVSRKYEGHETSKLNGDDDAPRAEGTLALWREKSGLWHCDDDYLEGRGISPESPLTQLIIAAAPSIRYSRDIASVRSQLNRLVPARDLTEDIYQAAVGNGIVDIRTLELRDYTPDDIYTRKTWRYIPDAPDYPYTMPNGDKLTFDQWLLNFVSNPKDEKSEPEERAILIKQVLAKAVCPNIPTRDMVILYDTLGSTGKGTFCVVIRGVSGGSDNCFDTSITLVCQSADSFNLQGLGTRTSIIMEENDVNSFPKSVEIFKNLISGDAFRVNRKGLKPISQKHHGLVFACCNAFPRFPDKTDSFNRRLILRRQLARNVGSADLRDIKDKWLKDPRVLDYATRIAIETAHEWAKSKDENGNPTFGTYTILPEDEELKVRYATFNDPIKAFATEYIKELEPEFEAIKKDVLYEIYKTWYQDSYGTMEHCVRKHVFYEQFASVCDQFGWVDSSYTRFSATGNTILALADRGKDNPKGYICYRKLSKDGKPPRCCGFYRENSEPDLAARAAKGDEIAKQKVAKLREDRKRNGNGLEWKEQTVDTDYYGRPRYVYSHIVTTKKATA